MTDLFEDDFCTEPPATERQIEYVTSLREQYENFRIKWAQVTGTDVEPVRWGSLPTGRQAASDAIEAGRDVVDRMRALYYAARDAADANRPAEAKAADDGLWVGADGRIFKIQKAREHDGRYAKAWHPETKSFGYLGGMVEVREIVKTCQRMTADQAAAFGHLYGVCVSCSRELTDETSIKWGYGAKCAANHGWPY